MASLRVENLQFRDWQPINFSLEAGKCACLTGPSGAGKTLLFRSIADLDPHKGQVFLDDKECEAFDAPEWRRHVSLLPADPLWWYPTVGEHFRQIDRAMLHTLGFDQDVLKWSVERLSMGERQRLAIFRMLINRPKVLLLDEPTAHLDPDNVKRVEGILTSYKKKHQATLLWTSHIKEQMQRVGEKFFYLTEKRLTIKEVP